MFAYFRPEFGWADCVSNRGQWRGRQSNTHPFRMYLLGYTIYLEQYFRMYCTVDVYFSDIRNVENPGKTSPDVSNTE